MRAEVHPYGYGESKGTHVSIFVRAIKGQYDENLNWPFKGKVKFELMNQLGDNSHLLRTLDVNLHSGYDWGFPEFIHHSVTIKHFQHS